MRSSVQLLGQPLQLSDLEQQFRKAQRGAFKFLFADCCVVDTQPPIPPGGGK